MELKNEDKLVARLSEMVALEYGIYPDVAKQLRAAAALHDIGELRIPHSILCKQDKLDAQEFEIMKTHTKIGAEMLSGIKGNLGEMARIIALYHHEWYDSTGSYWNKYTCELPAYVPIVSICDVFIALISSSRSYKSGWQKNEAIEYILKQSGTQFAPALVKVFVPLVQNDKVFNALFAAENI